MQKGSLIMLAKAPTWEDHEKARDMNRRLPTLDAIYTVSYGPALTYQIGNPLVRQGIQIEELGDTYFDPSYFIEVQEPMKVDLNEILVT